MDRDRTSLYDTDFYEWTQRQAGLLRSGRAAAADLGNIAEEIETLGRSELSAARSSLRLIIQHMLKALYQPERASRSWRVTIVRERIGLDELLDHDPGLRPRLDALFDKAYADGRRLALAETGLPAERIPEQPPFTLAEVRDESVLPAALEPSSGPGDVPG